MFLCQAEDGPHVAGESSRCPDDATILDALCSVTLCFKILQSVSSGRLFHGFLMGVVR
jgi:hypothetical protein